MLHCVLSSCVLRPQQSTRLTGKGKVQRLKHLFGVCAALLAVMPLAGGFRQQGEWLTGGCAGSAAPGGHGSSGGRSCRPGLAAAAVTAQPPAC